MISGNYLQHWGRISNEKLQNNLTDFLPEIIFLPWKKLLIVFLICCSLFVLQYEVNESVVTDSEEDLNHDQSQFQNQIWNKKVRKNIFLLIN